MISVGHRSSIQDCVLDLEPGAWIAACADRVIVSVGVVRNQRLTHHTFTVSLQARHYHMIAKHYNMAPLC